MPGSLRNGNKRRIFLISIVIALFCIGLILRLLWIQIIDVKHFSKHQINLVEEAVSQRQQSIVLHTGRGDIKDRNGKPLTGKEIHGVAFFPIGQEVHDERKVNELANILQMETPALLTFMGAVRKPTFIRNLTGDIFDLTDEEVKKVDLLELPGVLSLPVTERYQLDGLANHIIGYIGQNPEYAEKNYAGELGRGEMTRKSLIGASGLERSFDHFLQGVGPTSVSYFVDGKGKPLGGLKSRLVQQENDFYPLSLITTIDQELQMKIEDTMLEQKVQRGAVVVLDARTREVVSMASLPEFHPGKIDVEQGNWENHALRQIVPGSIFKTVVAAAVIEEGVVTPEEKFNCNGEYGKYGLSCWQEGGHGELTFSEAYAQSCNVTFAQAILRLSPNKIEEYGRKLGLMEEVGWRQEPFYKIKSFRQFSGEHRGQIFAAATSKSDEGVLVQTAIGQRDVQMTPLQAANMVATIINDGEKESVRVVQEIRYKTDSIFHSFGAKKLSGDQIKMSTAKELRKMMRAVVQEGTGKALYDSEWETAGKTGTAQASDDKNNQWFIGYGPVKNPQYVVVVVAEQEEKSAPNKVLSIFKDVMDELSRRK